MALANIHNRLCPHCANSVAAGILICPYCKADLVMASTEPEWPDPNEILPIPSTPRAEKHRLTVKSKVILVLGLLVFALGVYLVGGNVERHDLTPLLEEQQNALKEKDEKIANLETQLAQLRQDNQGTSQQIEQSKAKLEETQKDLAEAQSKLTSANREIARLAAEQFASVPRPAARTNDPLPAPRVAARATRTAEPRAYETLRTTPVYEQPANSSRVVAQIGRGTQITVIGSGNGWLEVRSKHGKPPGFIRADDAMFLSKAN